MPRLEPVAGLWANLRDLPGSLTPAALSAGLVAALMGVTGPVLLVYQAALDSGYTAEQTASWFFAVFAGGGVMGLVLAMAYRQPIAGAWSIAGAALLIQALPRYGLNAAVGAYLLSGAMITALALTGLFERVLRRIPGEIVMGMLAGVLLPFGAEIFRELVRDPLVVGATLAAFVAAHRWAGRFPPITAALAAGIIATLAAGGTDWSRIEPVWSLPGWYAPVFGWNAFFSLSLPLMLLALSSQNATGIGILWAEGYRAPVNAITLLTGLFSLATAPLGGHGVNMATPMTAICADGAAHPDPGRRYGAAVICNLLFAAFGAIAATAVALIEVLPVGLIRTVGGLALLPVVLSALRQSAGGGAYRYGALFALLIAASQVEWLGVGSAFWGLVGGTALSLALDREWRGK